MINYKYIYIIGFSLRLPWTHLFHHTLCSTPSNNPAHCPTVASWRSCHCFSLPTVAVAFGQQQQQLDRDSNNYNSWRFSLTLDQMPIVVVVVVTVELLLLFVLQSVALTKKSFLFFASPVNLCVSLANSPSPLPSTSLLLHTLSPQPFASSLA